MQAIFITKFNFSVTTFVVHIILSQFDNSPPIICILIFC